MVAGNGYSGYSRNGDALNSRLDGPMGIDVAPDGRIYFADSLNDFSYIGTSFSFGNIIPVANHKLNIDTAKGEGYLFDPYGFHIQTVDLDTKAVKKRFTYNFDGSLSSITDSFGNSVQVFYSSGIPYSIVAQIGRAHV